MPAVLFQAVYPFRTPEVMGDILDRMVLGHSAVHAAALAGVTPDELARWRSDDEAFSDRLDDAEAAAVILLAATMEARADKGDKSAALWCIRHGGKMSGV